MDTAARYCTGCMHKLNPPSFLKDPSATPTSHVYRTCMDCRAKKAHKRNRVPLQSVDPNIQPSKRVRSTQSDLPPTQQPPRPLQPPLPTLPAPSTTLYTPAAPH